jgi:hypothetical protein
MPHTKRGARLVVGLVFPAGGVLASLYGLFAVLYRGDGDGTAYVSLGDSDINARTVGVVALLIAVGVIAMASAS